MASEQQELDPNTLSPTMDVPVSPLSAKNCDFYSISYRCAFSPFSTVVVVVVVYAALKFVNT